MLSDLRIVLTSFKTLLGDLGTLLGDVKNDAVVPPFLQPTDFHPVTWMAKDGGRHDGAQRQYPPTRRTDY